MTGLAIGVFLGLTMIVFNFCRSKSLGLWLKFFVMTIVAFATPTLTKVTHFLESKYVGMVMFGYTCNQIWKG